MAVDWGGIIAGALGGAGGAVQNLAGGYIEDQRKLDVQQQMIAMQEAATERAAERAQKRTRADHLWKLSPEVVDQEVAAQTKKDTAASSIRVAEQTTIEQNRRAGEIAQSNDPAYLEGQRKLARARHIESQASIEQAALAKLQRTNLEAATKLRNDLAAERAKGEGADLAKIETLQKQITDLAYTGKDTAAAYRTWSSASARLLELEGKLTTAEPKEAERIRAEIAETRAMMDTAAKELGVKVPERGGKAPPVGTVVDGHRFKGGDPSQKANWEPVKPGAAPAAGAAAGPARPPEEIVQLDNARRAAEQELQKWGLIQQQKDPQGYAQARKALQDAEAAMQGIARADIARARAAAAVQQRQQAGGV